MSQISTSKEDSSEKKEMAGVGVLEITDRGYGFLRQQKNDYRATPGDIFVGKDFIRHGGHFLLLA